jgi:hypothetical protein
MTAMEVQAKEVPDGGWTDAEIARFTARLGRLIKEGMGEVAAEKLAEAMLLRDRPGSGDDRRICLECKGFKAGVCGFAERMGLRRGHVPLRTILQRCDGFVLRGAP